MNLEFNLLPKQIEYIESTADTCIYAGGVGAAKTIADVCLGIILCMKYPGIDGLITSPTYAMLKDTILREFKNLCPPGLLKKQNWGIYPEVVFKPKNGRESTIRFRAFDSALKPKGMTLGFWIGDEVTGMPEEILNEVENRVRQIGMPLYKRYTTNPDSKRHYFYKRFIEPAEQGLVSKEHVHYIHTTTYDNYLLPKAYIDSQTRKKDILPGFYRRSVLGEWGDFDDGIIGAFQQTPNFTSQYLVCFIDSSYSDKTKSDHTAATIVGFVPDPAKKQNLWRIEFTGKSWEKSITHPTVINELLVFLHKYQPIETCLESQLGDSTQIFIDRLVQAEKDLNLSPKNYWTWFHQTKNKHERISFHVAGNKDRLFLVENTDSSYINPIVSYTKKSDHDDEADSLAGAINLWQTSKILMQYISLHTKTKAVR